MFWKCTSLADMQGSCCALRQSRKAGSGGSRSSKPHMNLNICMQAEAAKPLTALAHGCVD